MSPEIVRLRRDDVERVRAAGHLFDGPPLQGSTDRFLADDRHHLLIAYQDGEPAGFVSGVEVFHPDKAAELFLYELGVDPPWQRRGIGTALVRALADLAVERGCTGMFVLTDADNDAALATYRAAGASTESAQVMLEWSAEALSP